MSEPSELTGQDWGEKYRQVRGTFESLALRLEALLKDLCKTSGFDVVQIESRAKEVDSFLEKISRKGDKYNDPLRDITDLVGVRIIAYYQEDVTRICNLIRAEFSIDEENSVDKASNLEPDRFGYISVHYVAHLNDHRAKLNEWKAFKGIPVEIQVRTALQHAWAAVNHKLDYKSVDEAPKEIQRKLFRLSALFELADEQFSLIRDERARISSNYAADVIRGNVDLPLNVASLVAYLESNAHIKSLTQLASELGFSLEETSHASVQRDRRDLLRVLDHYSIGSLSEVDRYFRSDEFIKAFRFIALLDYARPITLEDAIAQVIILDKNDRDLLTEIYTSGYEPFIAAMDRFHGNQGQVS